jgi:hypothetical protein
MLSGSTNILARKIPLKGESSFCRGQCHALYNAFFGKRTQKAEPRYRGSGKEICADPKNREPVSLPWRKVLKSFVKELVLEAAAVFEPQGLKRGKNLLTSCPDHIFFADAFFLKSEKRIMSLTMVMAIALLHLCPGGRRIPGDPQKAPTVPAGPEKATSHAAMRWIQLMDNIPWKPSGVRGLDEGRPEEDRLVLLSGGAEDHRG